MSKKVLIVDNSYSAHEIIKRLTMSESSDTPKAVLSPEELAEIRARAEELYPMPSGYMSKNLDIPTSAVIMAMAVGREAHINCATEERLKAKEEMRVAKLQHEDTFLKMMDARKQSREKDARIDSLQEERDQFAIDFASYMETERWKHDHREQKTHSPQEHLHYFKQKS